MATTKASTHRGRDWEIPFEWDHVPIILLQEIRDELKKLNAVFACGRFQAMPTDLSLMRSSISRVELFAAHENKRRRATYVKRAVTRALAKRRKR